MRFQSDPNLKPTEIQPPTAEQRTPAVPARKPAARAGLRRALRKGGTIALNGGILMLNLLKNSGSWSSHRCPTNEYCRRSHF
jgi:hypothetical protein